MHFLVKLVCAAPCRFCALAWSAQHFLAKLFKAAPCRLLPVAWTAQLSSAAAAVTMQNDATMMASVFMFFSLGGLFTLESTERRPALSVWLQLQLAVRARFVDDLRQILRQQVEHLVDRQAEVAGKILNLGIAENGFQLVPGDRHVLAVAQPGLDLRAEAALLQRRDQAVEIVVLRLRQQRIEHHRQSFALQRALETVKQTHDCSPARRPQNATLIRAKPGPRA